MTSNRKILKKVEYESARRKNMLFEKQNREVQDPTFSFGHLFLFDFAKNCHNNSRDSKEALVEQTKVKFL